MSYSIGLSKVRRSEAFLACAAILEEYGVEHRLEFGKKHPRIIINVGDRELVHTLNWHCGEWNNAKNSALQLRRLIQEAQRGEEEVGIQGSEVMHATTEIAVIPNGIKRPLVEVVDDEVRADSRAVAAFFGKNHKDVLRSIRDLNCSPKFRERNFAPLKINDLTGESTSHVVMTKDGFAFLAMGFTGARAGQFKESYIEAFNAMQDELTRRTNRQSLSSDVIEKIDRIDGISKMLSHKVTVIEQALPHLVAGTELALERLIDLRRQITDDIGSPVNRAETIIKDYVSAFEVVADMAEVPPERRYHGLTSWVTTRLQRVSAQAEAVPKLVQTFPGIKWMFGRELAAKWLADGGRRQIWSRVENYRSRRDSQRRLRLVGGK